MKQVDEFGKGTWAVVYNKQHKELGTAGVAMALTFMAFQVHLVDPEFTFRLQPQLMLKVQYFLCSLTCLLCLCCGMLSKV